MDIPRSESTSQFPPSLAGTPPAVDSFVTPAVRFEGVSKLYGTFAALRNVSVEFAVGSSTVILGDNGAGKSTLLRLVAGLLTPSRGTVTVLGGTAQQHRRRIAYMSHDAMLYDELTAMENLRYFAGLHASAVCSGACTGSPEMALRAVGLDPALKRPVGQYSQGMRQRASLARVLQIDPEILLLDEPFSNLDVDSAHTMVELLEDFRTWPTADGITGGRTLLLTTHQASLAEPLAETTIRMRAGTITSITLADHSKDAE